MFIAFVSSFQSSDFHVYFMISVCQRIVEEIDREIDKIAPSKKVDVGSYRLDGQGMMKRSSVSNYYTT